MTPQSVWSWEAGQYVDAPPVDVSGPMPGAIDAGKACEAIGYALESWAEYVLPGSCGGALYLANGTPAPAGAITRYAYQQERGRRQELEAKAATSRCNRDERPYFKDPQPLDFDPIEAFARDKGEGDNEKVKLAEVWADPLARTIWIALKARHLTSQYFRAACIEQAAWFRQHPPRLADDVRLSTGDVFISHVSYWCNVQVWPYIVYELQREGRWPYFDPPPALRVNHSLGWKVQKETE